MIHLSLPFCHLYYHYRNCRRFTFFQIIMSILTEAEGCEVQAFTRLLSFGNDSLIQLASQKHFSWTRLVLINSK